MKKETKPPKQQQLYCENCGNPLVGFSILADFLMDCKPESKKILCDNCKKIGKNKNMYYKIETKNGVSGEIVTLHQVDRFNNKVIGSVNFGEFLPSDAERFVENLCCFVEDTNGTILAEYGL